MEQNFNPCHTCCRHEGAWQACNCVVAKEEWHRKRCIEDHKEMHCIFYKNRN